jgi:hypothetical protein
MAAATARETSDACKGRLRLHSLGTGRGAEFEARFRPYELGRKSDNEDLKRARGGHDVRFQTKAASAACASRAQMGLYLSARTEGNRPFYEKYGFEFVGSELRQVLRPD